MPHYASLILTHRMSLGPPEPGVEEELELWRFLEGWAATPEQQPRT